MASIQPWLEIDYPQGLKDVVYREWKSVGLPTSVLINSPEDTGTLICTDTGLASKIATMRTVSDLFYGRYYPVERPAGLLNDNVIGSIATQLRKIATPLSIRTFRLSAAGRDSTVLQRLVDAIQRHSGLHPKDDGDLLLRLRPTNFSDHGWDLLVRAQRRPLSVRSWRVADYPGALDAPIAAALGFFLPHGVHTVANLMSGSGTILIELLRGPRQLNCIGVEHDSDALQCCSQNIEAAKLSSQPEVMMGDATCSSIADGVVDAVVSDLPWGERIGRRNNNKELYIKTLHECKRILRPGGRLLLITQDSDSLVSALKQVGSTFKRIESRKIAQGGYNPWLFVSELQS